MKNTLFISVFLFFSLFAATSATMASTSCTISISGPTGHYYSYEVQIEVIDLWVPTVVYNSGWISGSVGSYPYGIPYDVIPDCKDRWRVRVSCRQLYNGIPVGSPQISDSGPWSSDEYNDPTNLIYSFSF